MKAVVLETRGNRAAVLAKDGLVHIARGKYSVGETIDYEASVRPSLRQWIASAAAAAVALGMGAGLWVDRNYVACAEVSLDVNPSIVYTVNKRDRILNVRAVNAAAEAIVARLEETGVRFEPLEEALDQTMALLEEAGYLSAETEDYALLNVSADDETRQARLSEAVESVMTRTQARDATLEYRVDHSDRETARRAADNDMSPGRYAAWQRAGEALDGQTPDSAAFERMEVRELLNGPDGDAQRDAAPRGGEHRIEADEAPLNTADAPGAAADPPDEPTTAPKGSAEESDAVEGNAEARSDRQSEATPQAQASLGEADGAASAPAAASAPQGSQPAQARSAPSSRKAEDSSESGQAPDGGGARGCAGEGRSGGSPAAPSADSANRQGKSRGGSPDR